MITDFARGFGYALRGFSLVRAPGVFRYALVPLLVNAILFAGALWFGASEFSTFIDWLLPQWLDWALVRVVLWLVFALGAALVLFYAFTLVANLVAAPFNGLLAERVERHLRGARGAEGTERGLVAEAGASFGAEVRKMIYLALWSIPLLALFFVPLVNLLAPALWFAFGAWMMALEYADCPLGNHGVVFGEGRRLVGRRRALALGFGSAVMIITAIPILNLMAMPVAVAGATALYVEHLANLVSARDDRARE